MFWDSDISTSLASAVRQSQSNRELADQIDGDTQ
jgi:hypothetical protein